MSNIQVINPRTGVADFQFEAVSAAEMTQICQDAKDQQSDWSKLDIQERVKILLKWRDEIEKHSNEIIEALTTDTGRYSMSALEVNDALMRITYWCDIAPDLLSGAYKAGTSKLVPTADFESHQIPYELVGIISPWNVPLILSLIDAVPALLAGAAVVIKPSEITPRFSLPLRETIKNVPELDGVLKFVLGDADTGRALVNNVSAVCFTGSVATGKKVAVDAAHNFIPAFLELGGKDPVIVMQDADVDNATTAVLRSAVGLAGQTCQSLERIYVDHGIFKDFLAALSEKAKNTRLTHPDIRSGHIGPFIFPAQAKKVDEQLQDAVSRGATIHSGGKILNLDGGQYCEATVVSNVNHDMQLMCKETFGPIMPVMPYAKIDDAIALANDSQYGLSAAVFSSNIAAAKRVASQINAGAISINDGGLTTAVHDVEKNAFQNSGMGQSRMGASGLLRFFRTRSILHQTGTAMSIDMMAEDKQPKH